MEGRKNIGIGCEDEIDVFSPEFDPALHSMRPSDSSEAVSCGFAVASAEPKAKKVMKTANFGTNNTCNEDEEEEIITTKKPKYENAGIYTEACDPETNSVLCGPDFDNDPYFQQFNNKDAMVGPNDEGDYLENNIGSMFANFRLGALFSTPTDYEDLTSKIENAHNQTNKYRHAEVEHSVGIGTDTDDISQDNSIYQPTKDWDKEFGIDETDFRVSKTIEKWEDETNTKLFNQIHEQTQREEEPEEEGEENLENEPEGNESNYDYEASESQNSECTKATRSVDFTNEINLTYAVGNNGIENSATNFDQLD